MILNRRVNWLGGTENGIEESLFANDLLAQIRNEALKCGNEIEGERCGTQGYWNVKSTYVVV